MKRDDFMLLELTFLTGVAIGMYVYIAAFKPLYTPENLNDTEAEASEWSLVARRYGGEPVPGYSDPTFRVLGDGTYTYIPGGADGAAIEPRQGKLSNSVLKQLRSYDNSLMQYSYSASRNDCASYYDGYDYDYRFTKQNIVFDLDTCRTALGEDTPLAKLLSEVWDEIEGRQTEVGPTNFSDWAAGWINENIGVQKDNP
ncbi:MAG: hypothetical protein KBB78_03810 [Candidatus Pacebacteria bacterium]|nr:hypothetical protein [Candidatus Paceibacterota bacterium]